MGGWNGVEELLQNGGLNVRVLTVAVDCSDAVDVVACLVKLGDNGSVVPVRVWWLNQCFVVVGVLV